MVSRLIKVITLDDLRKCLDDFFNINNNNIKTKRTKFFLYYCSNENSDEIALLLEEVFPGIYCIQYKFASICFLQDVNDCSFDLKELFSTIESDYGEKIFVHEGFYLDATLNGNSLIKYFEWINQTYITSSFNYTRVSNLLLDAPKNLKLDIAEFIYNIVLKKWILNKEIHNMIRVFFDNNMNVLKTSQALCIHRNTLIYKIDALYKDTNFHLQNFYDAACIYFIMSMEE